MKVYVCEEKMDISPTGTDVLHLLEHQVQSKKIDHPSLHFTVPLSTKAITVSTRSGAAGTDIRVPPSKFTNLTGTHAILQNLRLTYANTTKPPTKWSSDSGTHILKLQQRYSICNLRADINRIVNYYIGSEILGIIAEAPVNVSVGSLIKNCLPTNHLPVDCSDLFG